MTSFILKIIAIISMIFDHSGYVFFGKHTWFNYIGRISFPIFAFQITEGYTHTKNFKKYFTRLLIFAIISQIPYMLFMSMPVFRGKIRLNVLFTLLFGLIAIWSYDITQKKNVRKIFSFLIVAILAIIAEKVNMDYGYFGVLSIFIFYIFKNKIILLIPSFTTLTFLRYFSINNIIFSTNKLISFSCTLIPLILICLYNGKQGKRSNKLKYFFYIFYPVHLLILYGIYLIK